MKKISQLLVIVFAFLFTNADAQHGDTCDKIKVTAERIGWLNVHSYEGRVKCLQVKVTLINITTDTLYYFSCNDGYSISTTSNEAEMYLWEYTGYDGVYCGGDRLTPSGTIGSTKSFNLNILPTKRHSKNFMVGFTWYKIDGSANQKNFSERMSNFYGNIPDDIIWSNEISFK